MLTKQGRIGYACLDLTSDLTYKTCRLKTFNEKGLKYIQELCLHNAKVLYENMCVNVKQSIHMFRISSNLMPWHHLYKPEQLDNYLDIKSYYTETGKLIKQHDIRVSFHPDHFTVLGSLNPNVIERSIEDMEHHSYLMDLLDAPVNHNAKINIHISNTKPNKIEAIKRFITTFNTLSDNTKKRTTIENDDNINGYAVEDLYNVYEQTGIPIVFDSLHYTCNPGKLNYHEALSKAISTWNGITPVVHHSSSKVHEKPDSDKAAHSDYLFEGFNYSGYKVDVMLEAKAKNLALLKYYKDFCS